MFSESLLQDTQCSAIACLFACLRMTSSGEVLDQVLTTIKTIRNGQVVQSVELAIYEAAEHHIGDIFLSKKENDASEQNAISSAELSSAARIGIGTKFLQDLVLAVFGDLTSSHASHPDPGENIRNARLSLVSNLVAIPILNSRTREVLGSKLSSWAETERSRPLRQKTEGAIKINNGFADSQGQIAS